MPTRRAFLQSAPFLPAVFAGESPSQRLLRSATRCFLGKRETWVQSANAANATNQPLFVVRLLSGRRPLGPQVAITTEYDVLLSHRRLVPGSPATPAVLSPVELRRYTEKRTRDNCDRPALQQWMQQHQLQKREGEGAMGFAWRVAEAVHSDFSYSLTSGPSDAESTCQKRAGDCGQISDVIVAVLRANGIPARLDVGFWTEPIEKSEPKCHVRCRTTTTTAASALETARYGRASYYCKGLPD